jgi:hypothetical protein
MNSDRWNRVDKMFHGAVSLPVPERAAYSGPRMRRRWTVNMLDCSMWHFLEVNVRTKK